MKEPIKSFLSIEIKNLTTRSDSDCRGTFDTKFIANRCNKFHSVTKLVRQWNKSAVGVLWNAVETHLMLRPKEAALSFRASLLQ